MIGSDDIQSFFHIGDVMFSILECILQYEYVQKQLNSLNYEISLS